MPASKDLCVHQPICLCPPVCFWVLGVPAGLMACVLGNKACLCLWLHKNLFEISFNEASNKSFINCFYLYKVHIHRKGRPGPGKGAGDSIESLNECDYCAWMYSSFKLASGQGKKRWWVVQWFFPRINGSPSLSICLPSKCFLDGHT